MRCFRWGYLTNLNLIGQAVFLSMDVPDTALAVSLSTACFLSVVTDIDPCFQVLQGPQLYAARSCQDPRVYWSHRSLVIFQDLPELEDPVVCLV